MKAYLEVVKLNVNDVVATSGGPSCENQMPEQEL